MILFASGFPDGWGLARVPLVAVESSVPKKDIPVRSTRAVWAEVPVLAINCNEVLTFQFLHISASLGFANAQFRRQSRNGRIHRAIAAGVAAKAAVNHLCAQGHAAVLANGLWNVVSVEQPIGIERFARLVCWGQTAGGLRCALGCAVRPLFQSKTSRRRPPAASRYSLGSGAESAVMRSVPNSCQRFAELAFWQIWGDEETVTYVLSTAVGGTKMNLASAGLNLLVSATLERFRTRCTSITGSRRSWCHAFMPCHSRPNSCWTWCLP